MELPDYVKARQRSKNKVLTEDYILDDALRNLGKGKKYFLKTYGCQMNEHDSENLKAMLEQLSFEEVNDYNDADLVLLNTCSIRENAHNKAFGMLGRLKHVKESTNPTKRLTASTLNKNITKQNKTIQKFPMFFVNIV